MGKIHQVHAAVAASYGQFLCGLLFVWPSYTASHYTDRNTTLLSVPMIDIEVSLIGSLPSLGAMLGTLVTGKIMNAFGRHKGGMILTLPYLVSWIMIDLTSSSIVIMIARFIGGFPCGAALVYGPIFISEVAEESIRGLLASGPIALYCSGTLLSYVLGWFVAYRYIIWINIALSCLGIVITMLVTESPLWLVMQKRETDARLAFARYRGVSSGSKMVIDEISRLKAQFTSAIELASIIDGDTKPEDHENEKLKDEEVVENRESVSSLKKLFTSPSSRRAFVITGLTLSFQVMMGMVAVQVYAKDIFSNAAPTLSAHLCSVILALILLLGCITSAAFTDKFGRKILIIVSATAVALCLICMGVLIQTNILPPWVTAVLILVYCYAFMLGSGSVPYVLLAECFKPEVQGIANILLIECVWFLNFVLLGIFPFMVKYFGVHGAFYCFSIFGILDILAVIFFLPETKGLTNDQIQELFSTRRKTLR